MYYVICGIIIDVDNDRVLTDYQANTKRYMSTSGYNAGPL